MTAREKDEIDSLLTTPTTSDTDLAAHLYIQNKQDALIPYVPNRVQYHFRQRRTSRDLVLKARQHGMSTEIQADHFRKSITQRVRSATLAHDDVGTQLLRRMADRFWTNLPPHLRPARGLDNATTTSYTDTGSEVLIVTAGGKNKGRAGTYSLVHGSEVAFWTDAASIMAGLLQGVPQDGQIALESTPNGAQGWFYDRCMEALDGDSDWTLHFYPWWWADEYALALDDGETLHYTDEETALISRVAQEENFALSPQQIKWRRSKQRELGRLFAQEYPEDPRTCFLVSGVGYFSDIHDLDKKFSAPVNARYHPQHRYVAAMDFGQQSDYSAVSVVDITTLEEVELWRINRIPWGDIRSRALQTCRKWHVEALFPERNSMGSTNIEELNKEFHSAGCKTRIVPFDTTPQSKPLMVTAFHYALDEGGLKLLPDPVGKQEIHSYTASQTPSGAWKYEGLPHDDTVVARFGAWYGAQRSGSLLAFDLNE